MPWSFEISFVEANTDLDIDLGNDSETIFLVTPQIIVHPIDEDSVSSIYLLLRYYMIFKKRHERDANKPLNRGWNNFIDAGDDLLSTTGQDSFDFEFLLSHFTKLGPMIFMVMDGKLS